MILAIQLSDALFALPSPSVSQIPSPPVRPKEMRRAMFCQSTEKALDGTEKTSFHRQLLTCGGPTGGKHHETLP